MSDINNFFQRFVKADHPYTPKFSAICVGGGASLSLLQTIPGASKFVGGIYLPYDANVVAEEIDAELGTDAAIRYQEKAVNKKTALDLAEMARRRSPDGVGIGITAALTTNRYRRGDTHAYIAFAESDLRVATVYHVTFEKLSKESHESDYLVNAFRQSEDEELAKLAVAICYGYDPDKLMDNKNLINEEL